MARRGTENQRLGDRMLAFLRERGEPASSHMLAERYLKTTVNSEELATRLLRPVLETMGAAYEPGAGWVVETRAPRIGQSVAPIFAGVVDPGSGEVHLIPVQADSAAPPADAVFVMLDPRVEAAALRQWLRRNGHDGAASIISLRSVVRGLVRLPRDAGLSGICEALGVRWLEGEDPRSRAAAMAACVFETLARRRAAVEDDPPPSDDPVALPGGITAQMLASLPESPGVYRFHDSEGRLIYVGKASNLRRRVSSYFTPAAARRPRRFQHTIHTLTHETVGSELESLLKEARLIERRAPSGNIQVQVHERTARYGGARAFAVLLPCDGARTVGVIFVRDGRYLGQVKIGPRGGGLAGARKLLGRAVCAGTSRRRHDGGTDRDSEILVSWLARHGDSVSRLDLDQFTKADQAATALSEAVKALLADPGTVVFR